MRTQIIAKEFVTVDGKKFNDRKEAYMHERTIKIQSKAIEALGSVAENPADTFNDMIELVKGMSPENARTFVNALRYFTIGETEEVKEVKPKVKKEKKAAAQ